jgi:hypothetical protein
LFCRSAKSAPQNADFRRSYAVLELVVEQIMCWKGGVVQNIASAAENIFENI